MIKKGNGALYLDKELVEKFKSLGFNLSKTFENHLKRNSSVFMKNYFNPSLISDLRTRACKVVNEIQERINLSRRPSTVLKC